MHKLDFKHPERPLYPPVLWMSSLSRPFSCEIAISHRAENAHFTHLPTKDRENTLEPSLMRRARVYACIRGEVIMADYTASIPHYSGFIISRPLWSVITCITETFPQFDCLWGTIQSRKSWVCVQTRISPCWMMIHLRPTVISLLDELRMVENPINKSTVKNSISTLSAQTFFFRFYISESNLGWDKVE